MQRNQSSQYIVPSTVTALPSSTCSSSVGHCFLGLLTNSGIMSTPISTVPAPRLQLGGNPARRCTVRIQPGRLFFLSELQVLAVVISQASFSCQPQRTTDTASPIVVGNGTIEVCSTPQTPLGSFQLGISSKLGIDLWLIEHTRMK